MHGQGEACGAVRGAARQDGCAVSFAFGEHAHREQRAPRGCRAPPRAQQAHQHLHAACPPQPLLRRNYGKDVSGGLAAGVAPV